MSSKIILYGKSRSPPVRAVLLTLNALELDYEFKQLGDGEHLSAEFVKKNPQHTVPTLEDNGKFIWDSHAICAFLVRKYGKDDSLYPKDFYQRALVDQRLHYENGVIFMTLHKQSISRVVHGHVTKEEFAEKLKAVDAIYDMLEVFLSDQSYFAGSSVTIADLSILSSISTMAALAPLTKHPKLSAWLERMQKLPYYEKANGEGLKALIETIKLRLK